MNEVWKAIPGYLGYEVSNLGNVRSYLVKGKTERLYEQPHRLSKATEVNERRYFEPAGYEFVLLRRSGKSHMRRVHQLVLEAFVGPRPAGYQGAHLNGNGLDNRVENLKWATVKENMSHKKLHGTNVVARGEDAGMSKLTNEQVLTIKARLNAGESRHSIALDYPVGVATIHAIQRNENWTHIGPVVNYTPTCVHMTQEQIDGIVSNIKAGRTIQEIAKEVGYNVSTVSRTFKKATGISIREFREVA